MIHRKSLIENVVLNTYVYKLVDNIHYQIFIKKLSKERCLRKQKQRKWLTE